MKKKNMKIKNFFLRKCLSHRNINGIWNYKLGDELLQIAYLIHFDSIKFVCKLGNRHLGGVVFNYVTGELK